eukprot:12203339-Prorocentrum_lima.AAC.1
MSANGVHEPEKGLQEDKAKSWAWARCIPRDRVPVDLGRFQSFRRRGLLLPLEPQENQEKPSW